MMFLAVANVPHAILVLAFVASAGLALGCIRIYGFCLGTAGVLFAGIVFGHLGFQIDPTILEFVREFGLILFVFCIGLQLGPGFFASFRRDGLRLNLLAFGVVLLGAAMTVFGTWALDLQSAASLGLFSGATTNTPALGAVQQTVISMGYGEDMRAALPALAYAVAYPIGIAGIIGSLLILRRIFRIDAEAEAVTVKVERLRNEEPLMRMNLVVENANLHGLCLAEVPGRLETRVAISRVRKHGESIARIAGPEFVLHLGDSLLAVGTASGLDRFRRIVGRAVEENLLEAPTDAVSQRVAVTKSEALDRSIQEVEQLYGVTATRLNRGEVEMPAAGDLRLKFGDALQLVGTAEHLKQASAGLGNSLKELNHTHFIPIFIGIALGVIAGLGPITIPGLPVPMKLGLAGGTLILAILLSRLGHFGWLIWHMPLNANLAFRDLGITLFLACVGLKAGERFFAMVLTVDGLLWLACALGITLVPLLAIGIVARRFMRLDFTVISGLLAGSMTDPPALAFASSVCKSDAPAISYATVYPLAMLLRILAAEVLTLLLWR